MGRGKGKSDAQKALEARIRELKEQAPVVGPVLPYDGTEEEAKELVDQFHEAYPGLRQWAEERLGITLTDEQNQTLQDGARAVDAANQILSEPADAGEYKRFRDDVLSGRTTVNESVSDTMNELDVALRKDAEEAQFRGRLLEAYAEHHDPKMSHSSWLEHVAGLRAVYDLGRADGWEAAHDAEGAQA